MAVVCCGESKRLWLSKPMVSHFGLGAPPSFEPILVVGLVDVHWGYGILTHGHMIDWAARLLSSFELDSLPKRKTLAGF